MMRTAEQAETPASSVSTAHDHGVDVEMLGTKEKQLERGPVQREPEKGPEAVMGEATEEDNFPEGGVRAWSVVFGTGMVMAFR